MRHFTPEIVYHELLPIYSVDIQPKSKDIFRLATGGFDCFVRIWKIEKNVKCVKKSNPVELLANLKRHDRRVNIVRWSPDGQVLASASDDKTINLWSKSTEEVPVRENTTFGDDDDDFVNIENWVHMRCLRRHIEEVYDLSWSSNSNQFVSGSIDSTAILWDLKAPIKPMMLKDHKQFVQGVAWDPLDNFVITQSNDRTFRVYRAKSRQCLYKVWRAGDSKLFYDGSWKFFYRRPEFSPDGRLLITPAGICNRVQQTNNQQLDEEELNQTDYLPQQQNAAHIFVRHNLSKVAVTIPTGQASVLGVRFNPVRFNLRSGNPSNAVFRLPYRWVFALIVETGVLIFDTEQESPIVKISNIHCLSITDASWSPNGRVLVVSSTDGYCTYVYFEEGELGEPFFCDQRLANSVLKSVENTGTASANDESSKPSSDLPDSDDKVIKNVHDQTTELLGMSNEPKKDQERSVEDQERSVGDQENDLEEEEEIEEDDDMEDEQDQEMQETNVAQEPSVCQTGEQADTTIDLTADSLDAMDVDNVSNAKKPTHTPKITSLFPSKQQESAQSLHRSSSTNSLYEDHDLEARIKRANSTKTKRRVTATLLDTTLNNTLEKITEEESAAKKAKYSTELLTNK